MATARKRNLPFLMCIPLPRESKAKLEKRLCKIFMSSANVFQSPDKSWFTENSSGI